MSNLSSNTNGTNKDSSKNKGYREEIVKERKIGLEEVLDLTVTEMLILQYLQKYTGPTVRIALLETINAILSGEKKIPSSSFYNKLDKLRKRGLIEYVEDKEGKSDKMIQATELASDAMDIIKELSFYGSVNIYQLNTEYIPKFLEYIGLDHVDNVILINLEEGIDIRTIKLIDNFTDKTFLVCDDETYERYIHRGIMSNIIQSKVIDGRIREPDNFFDGCLIVGYEIRKHDKIPAKNWLIEGLRVIKPGGLFMVATVEAIPKIDHFLIQNILSDLAHKSLITQITKEKLKEDIEGVGVKDLQIFTYSGVILALGRKEE